MRVDLHPRGLSLRTDVPDDGNADAVLELAASQGGVTTLSVAVEHVVRAAVRRRATEVPRPLERSVDVAIDVVGRHEVVVVDTVSARAPGPALRHPVSKDRRSGDVVRVPGSGTALGASTARCHGGHRCGGRRGRDGLLGDGQGSNRLGLEGDDGLDESRVFTHQLGGCDCQQLTLRCGQGPTSNDACLDVTESGGDYGTGGTGAEQTAHTHAENADDSEPTQLLDGIHTILPFFLGWVLLWGTELAVSACIDFYKPRVARGLLRADSNIHIYAIVCSRAAIQNKNPIWR